MSDENGRENTVQPWDEPGLNPKQRMAILVRRYNGLVRACDKQSTLIESLMTDKEKLGKDVRQLNAEVSAARLSSTALAGEINDAGKADREEVMRLRALLKKNDIPIGG